MSGCGDVCDGSCLYSQYMGGRGSLGYIVDLSETLSHKTGSWVLTQWRVTIGTLQLHLHLKTLLWNAALTRHGCCHLGIVDYPHKRPSQYWDSLPEGRESSQGNKAVNGITKETTPEAVPASCPPLRIPSALAAAEGKSASFGTALPCSCRKSLIHALRNSI